MIKQSASLQERRKFDIAPWTFQQTCIGILVILVPWLGLSILLSSPNKELSTQPLGFQQDLGSSVVIFIFATLVEAFFIITPLYYARYVYRAIENRRERWLQALRALGFRKTPFWHATGLVLAGFVLIVVVNLGYSVLLEWLHQVRPDLHLQTNDEFVCNENKLAPISTGAQLLVAFAIAPICEEIFFRGFVFAGLRSRMTLIGAILFSALIFGVAHADITSFPILFFIGFVLAYLRWNTCSIWPGIVLHMLNNGVSAVVIVTTCR